MKHTLLFAGVLIIHCFTTQAQTFLSGTLNLKNGTKHSFDLSALQKITFANSAIDFSYQSSAAESFSLASVKSITFSDLLAIRSTVLNSKIALYPNPVSDFATVRNLPDGNNRITILRQDGSLMMDLALSAYDRQINLSKLTSGLYLLKVGNQVTKFIKR